MNLMTLVRFSVLVVVGWTAVALGAGVLGVGTSDRAGATFYIPDPSLVDTVTLGGLERPSSAQHRLIDRTSGQIEPLQLPADKQWSLLSVSPWRDQDGFSEAVGRWISRAEGEEAFCGLGLLKLPGGILANCFALEILPTGKPCWVPGRTGEILFPAGDGQLYRFNIDGTAGDGTKQAGHNTSQGVNRGVPRVVMWKNSPPGSGDVYLCDPAWSAEPALRNLVFVALSEQEFLEKKKSFSPFKVWWLHLNDEGDTILSAGRLTRSVGDKKNDGLSERMPTVTVGAGGLASLLYLTRERCAQSWQLRTARLETDQARSQARIRNGSAADNLVADGLAVSPLVVSADAKSVHVLDISGAHREHVLTP